MIESTCFNKNPPASPSSSLRTHGNPHPLSYRSLLTTSDDCDLLYAGRMLRIYCLFSVTQNLHCVLLRPSGRGASPKHPPLGVVVWEGAHPDSCNDSEKKGLPITAHPCHPWGCHLPSSQGWYGCVVRETFLHFGWFINVL